jgi:protein-S-isoprenylcysteine O-methyltransferase Ste14
MTMTKARDTAGVLAPPPLIALAVVVLGLTLDRLLPAYVLSLLLSLPERIVIGLVVMGAGAALGFTAVLGFRRAQTHVEPWKSSAALVTDGIFKWLRNPMYVGATMLLAGFAVLFASDWTLVMTVAFVVVLHFGVIKREEHYLETKFGDVYRGYKARVPRYGWPPV